MSPPTEDQPRFFNIWQDGLGYNNLIYIATVLGDPLKRRARFPYGSISLFIEEPEAHLHPQLQDVLFRYLQEIESQNIQVFLSSHSPTITAKTHLDSLIVLCDREGCTLSTPVSSIGLDEEHKHFLQRFLDVTKCQLFFANSVILVEGISEALLSPSCASAMGDEFDLDRNGVEVVNIGGVAFEPLARLFNAQEPNKRLNARCAILTDDDRTVPVGDDPPRFVYQVSRELALGHRNRLNPGVRLCGCTQRQAASTRRAGRVHRPLRPATTHASSVRMALGQIARLTKGSRPWTIARLYATMDGQPGGFGFLTVQFNGGVVQ